MAARLFTTRLVLLLLAGTLHAADNPVGVVVSYDKDTMKLVVKIANKERTLQLTAKTHVG